MNAWQAPWMAWLVLLGGAAYLQYLWGRRANWRIIRNTAAECERALRPKDQRYTWIGGLIGYRADYVVRRGDLNRVEATLTALPRHSLLYFPVSWAWRRYDALYLLWRPNMPLRSRAHAYLVAPGVLAPRIRDVAALHEAWVTGGGHRYRLLYSGEQSRRLLTRLVEAGASPLLRHVSINPEEGAVYCRVVARPGQVAPLVERLAGVLQEL
ncbi:MAG: hypothetical protein IMX02_07680 [Limnochordaceae bacterium]|nr:hypothetical protein [Limnochordaceae bacterium]